MKKVLHPAVLNLITVVLFGMALITLYDAQTQFAHIVKNQETSWEISINILPILIFFVICTPISLFLFFKGKKRYKSWSKALMLPPELKEADEREKMLTAKACRSAYITMWISAPIGAGLLLLYPLIEEIIPFYPIIIILLLMFSQILSYFISLQKNL